MGIRLNKVLSELDIGVQTVIEFLKTNHIGEVSDKLIQNSKITDEQYKALLNKFGTNKDVMLIKTGQGEQKEKYTNIVRSDNVKILKQFQNGEDNIVIHSEDAIDQLFNDLNAQNLTVDNKLDLAIRMAIRKVKLQKYYNEKLKENKEQLQKNNAGAIIFAATINKKKNKKKQNKDERVERSVITKQAIDIQKKNIEGVLSKLFYTSNTIDNVINFLKRNKMKYDAITEYWIRNSIEGDDVLEYYVKKMNKEFSGYQTIVDNMLRMKDTNNNESIKLRVKLFRKEILNYLATIRNGQKYIKTKEPAQKPLKKKEKTSSYKALQKIEWILNWNCVMFKRGRIIIYARSDLNVKFKPKELSVPKSIESFNYIKKYLNERIPPVRCIIEGQNLKVIDPINFNEAILQFAAAAQQGAIKAGVINSNTKYSPLPMSFSQALSKAKQMTPEEFKKYKSKYIDFLVDMQSKEYKVIPCVERLAHSNSDTTEYSFIFSIECTSNFILIVHENVNPDRSTLLFLLKKENYNKAIREIYDFLQSAEINKRSSLREKALDIKNAGILHYRSINHDDIYTWKKWISFYKNYS